MGRAGQDGWCILRTGASRTLPLAASLTAAGFDVWTPTEQVTRLGRGKKRNDKVTLPAPIAATFVFARADRLADLLAVTKLPVSPHPAFSIQRHDVWQPGGSIVAAIPIVSDRSLDALRQAEAKVASKGKRIIPAGSGVHPQTGAWAGMKGTVLHERGKETIVDFGGGLTVSIASYLLVGDVLKPPPSPDLGIAA